MAQAPSFQVVRFSGILKVAVASPVGPVSRLGSQTAVSANSWRTVASSIGASPPPAAPALSCSFSSAIPFVAIGPPIGAAAAIGMAAPRSRSARLSIAPSLACHPELQLPPVRGLVELLLRQAPPLDVFRPPEALPGRRQRVEVLERSPQTALRREQVRQVGAHARAVVAELAVVEAGDGRRELRLDVEDGLVERAQRHLHVGRLAVHRDGADVHGRLLAGLVLGLVGGHGHLEHLAGSAAR